LWYEGKERRGRKDDFNVEKGERLFLLWILFPLPFPSFLMIFTENRRNDKSLLAGLPTAKAAQTEMAGRKLSVEHGRLTAYLIYRAKKAGGRLSLLNEQKNQSSYGSKK
jgi:hypothetical protein